MDFVQAVKDDKFAIVVDPIASAVALRAIIAGRAPAYNPALITSVPTHQFYREPTGHQR